MDIVKNLQTLLREKSHEGIIFVEKNESVPIFDRAFNCLQHMGTLKPHEKQKIPITYSPNYPSNDLLYDYFHIYTAGRFSKSVVTCVAQNQVPQVQLQNWFINFGLCNVGEKVCKTFELKNNGETAMAFQVNF